MGHPLDDVPVEGAIGCSGPGKRGHDGDLDRVAGGNDRVGRIIVRHVPHLVRVKGCLGFAHLVDRLFFHSFRAFCRFGGEYRRRAKSRQKQERKHTKKHNALADTLHLPLPPFLKKFNRLPVIIPKDLGFLCTLIETSVCFYF